MKAFVASICSSHAACEYLAPEVFRVGDRGFVEVLMDPDESMRRWKKPRTHAAKVQSQSWAEPIALPETGVSPPLG
jgi:ferredoxin